MAKKDGTDLVKKEEELAELAALASLTDDELREMADLDGSGTFRDLFNQVDKERLIGKELIIMKVALKDQGDYDRPYVTVWGRTLGPKGFGFVFSDGSTGINAQIRAMAAAKGGKVKCPFRVPSGLRVSRYAYEDENGKETPAETYYLDGAGE